MDEENSKMLSFLTPIIGKKMHMYMRRAICPHERLVATLTALAAGGTGCADSIVLLWQGILGCKD
jgi:hypothetical protein